MLFQPQLIEKYGYPAETHDVVTEDGYILTMHRIPSSVFPPKRTVLIQHGISGSSDNWVLPGPNAFRKYISSDGLPSRTL